MQIEVIREYSSAGTAWFVETGAARPKPVVVPAQSAPTDADGELRRAFNDLMRALAPAERTAITRDLRGRAIERPKAGRTKFEDTPETRAAARGLFGF